MSTLPPELLRKIAKTAHPETTRSIKRLSRFLETFITSTDLQTAEACWRLGKEPVNKCLFWAVRNSFLKIASTLLSSFGASANEVPDSKSRLTQRDKDIALVWAAESGSPEIVTILIAYNADMHAARDDSAEKDICETIYSHKRSLGIHMVNEWAYPLAVAAAAGDVSIVSLFLEAGANVVAGNGDALYAAAVSGHLTVVSILLKAGATIWDDVVRVAAEYGHHSIQALSYALLGAVEKGHSPIVALLLTSGANVHAIDDSALETAAQSGYDLIVELLLNAGADVHAKDGLALKLAAQYGHDAIVERLLNAGADVQDYIDYAMVFAAGRGHELVVARLLRAGANVDAMNNGALRWAMRSGHSNVVAMLVAAGADMNVL